MVGFPVGAIFRAVMDIESYPEVLSFVRSVRILEKGEGHILARVHVGLPLLNFSYDCRIEFEENSAVQVRLISGPFKRMEALWTFEALDAGRTNVVYSLDAEFKNPIMERTAGAIFASQINHSISAFEERLKRS
jgi:coenzyme Q-binding protein COQ10